MSLQDENTKNYGGLWYFFQRPAPHNDIIAVQDHDADMYVKNGIFKLIGHSDGKTYFKTIDRLTKTKAVDIQAHQQVIANIKKKIDKAREEMDNITNPQEMKEMLEKNPLSDELLKAEKELNAIKEKINTDALKAEIKVAIKNGAKRPPNKDVVFFDKMNQRHDTDADKLLNGMNISIG